MSSKIVLAAVATAALLISMPGVSIAQTSAQTSSAPQQTTTDKAADKKTKADARKAAAAERKTKIQEKKTSTKADRSASRDRQRQCGVEWKQAKAENKVEKGLTWPKFYSACNKRLKEKAA